MGGAQTAPAPDSWRVAAQPGAAERRNFGLDLGGKPKKSQGANSPWRESAPCFSELSKIRFGNQITTCVMP